MPPGTSSHSPPSGDLTTILSISPFEADHVFLEHAFSHSNWKVHGVRSRAEALGWLQQKPAPVVLCEESLPDCNWKDVLAGLEKLSDPPVLIVTSRLADDALWAEVLSMGAYDLLMKPFDVTEVFRVVSLGWRHWHNNWERARTGMIVPAPVIHASPA